MHPKHVMCSQLTGNFPIFLFVRFKCGGVGCESMCYRSPIVRVPQYTVLEYWSCCLLDRVLTPDTLISFFSCHISSNQCPIFSMVVIWDLQDSWIDVDRNMNSCASGVTLWFKFQKLYVSSGFKYVDYSLTPYWWLRR